jgi:hypothetical protein
MPPRLSPAIAGVAIVGLARLSGAQACLDTAGFVRTNGRDTLVVERVEVTPTGLLGVQRSPDGIVRYDLKDEATAVSVGVQIWSRGTRYLVTPPAQSGSLVLEGERATFTARQGDAVQRQQERIVAGAVPLLDVAAGLEERLLRLARHANSTSVDLPTFYIASGGYAPTAHVAFIGRDSAKLRLGDDMVIDLRIDSIGRVTRAWYRKPNGDSMAYVARVPCGQINKLIQAPD